MKKIGVLLAAVLLCVSSVAFAQEDDAAFHKRSMMLEGTVEPGSTMAVMAPFGGVVLDASISAGDIVQAGDVLHIMQTTKVYAPFDGTVGSVGLQAGDDVAEVLGRYDALMYIEPASPFTISTTTGNAYDEAENYIIHVGEPVYLRSTETHTRTGVGFVTSVDDKKYSVEVTDGNLKLDEYVNIYRTPEFRGVTRIGSGDTERNTNVAITADSGTVYQVHVNQGDAVKRGDLLMELVTGEISMQDIPSNEVKTETAGVVASVDAKAGETVTKNQLLSTLYPFDDFQVAVSITESDLPYVAIGDTVRIELTNVREEPSFIGKVQSISGLNTQTDTEADVAAASYTVYIDFTRTDAIRQGMNVNVYFNEE